MSILEAHGAKRATYRKLVKVRAREFESSSIPAFLDLDKRTHI
jgi:hypothetical protein